MRRPLFWGNRSEGRRPLRPLETEDEEQRLHELLREPGRTSALWPGSVTNHHKLGGLGTEIYSLSVQEARSPKSRRRQGWFLLQVLRGKHTTSLSQLWVLLGVLSIAQLVDASSLQSLPPSSPLPSPLCLSVSSPLLVRPRVTRLRAHPKSRMISP